MNPPNPDAGQFGIPASQWQKWLDAAKRYDHAQAVRRAIKHFKPSGKRPPRKDQPTFDPPPAADQP